MDLADDVRLRQNEQIVVSLEVVRMVAEAFSPVIGLTELVALDHRAHRAIEDQDARFERGVKLLQTAGSHEGYGAGNRRKLLIRKGVILTCGWRLPAGFGV